MSGGKIEAYIGFSIKSGKIAIGSGAISAQKGGVELIILDAGAAKNTRKLAFKFKNRFNCPLVVCKAGFEKAVNREGAKIAAIKDKSLSEAILNNLDGNYEKAVSDEI